jgi:hypothetical protein
MWHKKHEFSMISGQTVSILTEDGFSCLAKVMDNKFYTIFDEKEITDVARIWVKY